MVLKLDLIFLHDCSITIFYLFLYVTKISGKYYINILLLHSSSRDNWGSWLLVVLHE